MTGNLSCFPAGDIVATKIWLIKSKRGTLHAATRNAEGDRVIYTAVCSQWLVCWHGHKDWTFRQGERDEITCNNCRRELGMPPIKRVKPTPAADKWNERRAAWENTGL